MNTTTGQLGIVVSSARYKHDIRDMGGKSSALLKLRPVTFRYNNDPAGHCSTGWWRRKSRRSIRSWWSHGPDGKVMTVRYPVLSAMLLNELQKLSAQMAEEKTATAQAKASTDRRIAELQANHDRELRAMQATFEQRLSALERATGAGAPAQVKF